MSRTNEDRIDAGRAIVEAWRDYTDSPTDESNGQDAISDILHYLHDRFGLDPTETARIAAVNTDCEIEPDDIEQAAQAGNDSASRCPRCERLLPECAGAQEPRDWEPVCECEPVDDEDEPTGEGGPPYDAATATGMYDPEG